LSLLLIAVSAYLGTNWMEIMLSGKALISSTEDHAEADWRTLADLNEAAGAADACACG